MKVSHLERTDVSYLCAILDLPLDGLVTIPIGCTVGSLFATNTLEPIQPHIKYVLISFSGSKGVGACSCSLLSV